MYTQCSSCATLFSVDARHLREAGGLVRCCLCRETFSALATLTEVLPPDLPLNDVLAGRARIAAATHTRYPLSPPPAPQPLENEAVEQAMAPGGQADAPVEAADADAWQIAEAPADDTAETATLELAPAQDLLPGLDLLAQLEPPPAGARRRRWPALVWAAGCLCLLGLLMAQYGVYLVERSAAMSPGQRAQADYVGDPRYRPWFENLCRLARCQLPPLRDIASIHILRRRVSAPANGTLSVSATLVNDAGFNQAYPQLRLGVLDSSGRERASRWFLPSEYLEDAGLRERLAQGMASKIPVAVRLELVDPGEGAAEGFEFDFR